MYIRKPIVLFQQIKESKKSTGLLHNLKSACPKGLSIGIAIATGSCFFDSVAQVLNELNIRPGYHFTAKSLREDCADYAKQHGEQGSWIYKAVIGDAAIGGYFVNLESPYGPIKDPKTQNNIIDESKTFEKYLENIKNMATEGGPTPIWGRPDIEGRMICNKYKVKIEVIELLEKPLKESTEDQYIIQSERGQGDNVVCIVNYMSHFVPLLSRIPKDITESQPVSREEILGTDKEIPPSHQPEQKTRQEGIQKRLTNNYKKKAICGTFAMIATAVFVSSTIAIFFTKSIPLVFLAGIALVVACACMCTHQSTQNHKNINELKSNLEESSVLTIPRESGIKNAQS